MGKIKESEKAIKSLQGRDWKGTTIDWDGFNVAKKERWVDQGSHIFECKKHHTFFDGEEEPCWQCWDEFTITL